ncbi:hypothetical protein [Paenibacillus rhizoplanae]
MTNPPQRTDPRVLRTRQFLKEALIELMEEMSIEKSPSTALRSGPKLTV